MIVLAAAVFLGAAAVFLGAAVLLAWMSASRPTRNIDSAQLVRILKKKEEKNGRR